MEKDRLIFHPDRPCTIAEEHNGRETIIHHAFGKLGTDDVQCFAIIGFNRIGKTSLLNCLRQPSIIGKYLGPQASRYSFLYMNIKEKEIPEPEIFFMEFYSKIKQLLNIDGLKNRWDDLPRITDFLEKSKQKLIVMFDDFNLIITNPNFPVAFFEGLRSWFSTHGNVGCIVSSPVQLLNLSVPVELAGSPFFNIFDSYSIPPLTPTEAIQLIKTRCLPGMLEREKDVSMLIDHFGCSPYPLHLAGKIWVDQFQNGNTSIEDSIPKSYEACIPYYEEIYSSLNNKQLENIASILSRKKKKDSYIDRTLIDRGWIKILGNDGYMPSRQMKRFFCMKLKIHYTEKSRGRFFRGLFKSKNR